MGIRQYALAMLALSGFTHAAAAEPVDYEMIGRIMDEGFNRSHVMETLYHLTDDIGPRLTNSPGMREAARWSKGQFESYGLVNTGLEYFPFGRGWTYDSLTVHMTAPRRRQVSAMPVAWYPGTEGPVEGEVILAVIEDDDDFETFRGKLEGKIVLVNAAREQDEPAAPVFVRLNDEQLADVSVFPVPDPPSMETDEWLERLAMQEKIDTFLEEEGALALVRRSRKEAGLIEAQGYRYEAGNTPAMPAVSMASEDYDRIVRLVSRDETVALRIDVKAQFYDDDHNAQNVIAEIPGRGSRPGIVMAGAHLDSWFMADGASDNAAGSAVVLEAARILKVLGVQPKRTIRFALWDGEEQGLIGSLYHVEQHFASRPDELEDKALQQGMRFNWAKFAWPIKKGRDFERLSAYFNLDNGSGRIRGIYGEGNPALQPIFERWMEPFHELGAATVVLQHTGGTDHRSFQLMGLPGFQFIQDPLDYGSRLHHSDIDTASHVYEKDLQQAAIIMASFLWHAANRAERLPRMPLPTKPKYAPVKKEGSQEKD